MDVAVHEEFIANSTGGSGLVPWRVDPLHWTSLGEVDLASNMQAGARQTAQPDPSPG